MPNLFHKYQQPILIVVTVVIIASFIWFWNGSMATRGGIGGTNKVASIYGETVSDTDIQKDVHKFQIASVLGMNDMLQALAGNAENQQQALENFIWNTYVFDHEADALQVYPTDVEVQDELSKVPGFQTDGRFDPAKLEDFVQSRLPSLGFTDAVIDELVRREVRVRKVTELIGSTVAVSTAELATRYQEGHEKMDLQVIRLNTSDLEKGITVTDADAQKAYDANKGKYVSDEQRKVSIASFELTPDQEALKGKDRTDVLQKLGNEAWNFAQAVVDKSASFGDQAKSFGAPVSDSAYFTANQPDPALSKIPALATTAFKLSPDYPSSDVVEGENGYYVLHLEQTVPSRQLSFAEAKPEIVEQIQKDRASQLLQTKANDIESKIEADMKGGKSFEDAAADAGVTPDKVPPFALMDVSKLDIPDMQAVVQNALGLADGKFSEFVTTDAGGLFVYMEKHEPVDPITAGIGGVAMKTQVQLQRNTGTFVEWLRIRKEAARLQIVQRAG